ncbi:MAG: hypothetical protein M1834_006246 [Cirrosporium novae-zelandiae]|nr:MAG: hypothetical protein M1834_006246 [Cirrosporium novae-zelandiae]
MPAINHELVRATGSSLHMLAKRSNWAGKNAGVMVVFCIVFVVAAGLISLFTYRKCMARKAIRETRRQQACQMRALGLPGSGFPAPIGRAYVTMLKEKNSRWQDGGALPIPDYQLCHKTEAKDPEIALWSVFVSRVATRFIRNACVLNL